MEKEIISEPMALIVFGIAMIIIGMVFSAIIIKLYGVC